MVALLTNWANEFVTVADRFYDTGGGRKNERITWQAENTNPSGKINFAVPLLCGSVMYCITEILRWSSQPARAFCFVFRLGALCL